MLHFTSGVHFLNKHVNCHYLTTLWFALQKCVSKQIISDDTKTKHTVWAHLACPVHCSPPKGKWCEYRILKPSCFILQDSLCHMFSLQTCLLPARTGAPEVQRGWDSSSNTGLGLSCQPALPIAVCKSGTGWGLHTWVLLELALHEDHMHPLKVQQK